ncbi:MAG: amidohydrolase [Balneolaceae bacterium]|nr:amidohydrolase [Balneolaceae bacterium]
MKNFISVLIFLFVFSNIVFGQSDVINNVINDHFESLEELYKHFHANPELSLQEENTSRRLAEELRQLGFSVTEQVGGHGIVAVYENGDGPVILVRSDMDALPMREETGVPFASTATAITVEGEETYVMHACGHDLHMAAMVGTANVMLQKKDQWNGTLVFIGQPAEELFLGARAMIRDGLFERFPLPDYMLALHVDSAMPSGQVGFSSGYAYANVDMGEIVVRGRGGHGAYPNYTVDPVVMASRIVLDLHTMISREISATDPANISIGSIRGGSSANIIPNEVRMEIALNVHNENTRERLIRRIEEKLKAAGIAEGLSEEEWPQLILNDETRVASVYNDPEMGERVRNTFQRVLGPENVHETLPFMYGEDFGEYNHAMPDIPGLLFGVGSIPPDDMKAAEAGLKEIPTTHSPLYLPDLEPTLRTGILTMSSAIIDLMSGN